LAHFVFLAGWQDFGNFPWELEQTPMGILKNARKLYPLRPTFL
jgi:hypothetical protein